MAACSSPPTAARTPSGSPGSGPFTLNASSTTLTLSSRVWSSIPVPRPVVSVGGLPVKAEMRQAAGVVLPMPISPATSRSTPPLSISSSATPAPAITARAASSRLMAGPRLRSSVECRTFAARKSGCPPNSPATPTSSTLTLAPTVLAMAFTAALPSQKFPTIAAVTSWGQGETPRPSTPWSPAQTRTAGFSGTGGGHSPAIPAIRTPRSSNRPRLPGGLASPRCLSRAFRMVASSTGGISAASSNTRSSMATLVMVAVLVLPRLVGVVVGRRCGAYLLLEAGQRDPVDAHVAVHADVPLDCFGITFDHKVSHAPVRPEVSGVADIHFTVGPGERFGLLADALFEDASEEEVGEDHDAPYAEFVAAIQGRGDIRRRHADVRALDHRIRAALVEQAGHLREVRVGVGVGGTASDEEYGRVFLLPFRDHGGDALVHELQ